MGAIFRTVRVADLYSYDPEFNEDGTEKHVHLDGARFHVLSWGGGPNGSWCKCSVPNCEINRERHSQDQSQGKS